MRMMDGAQQFQEKDLKDAGKELTAKEYQSIFGRGYRKGEKKPRVFLVTVDDVNLFLRTQAREWKLAEPPTQLIEQLEMIAFCKDLNEAGRKHIAKKILQKIKGKKKK